MKLDEIKRNAPPEKTMDINYHPQTREEIETWIKEHIGLRKIWITSDLEVDFLDLGGLYLGNKKLKGILPIKIRKIKGELDVSRNQLTSFENFPEECGRIFASDNKFTSLVGVDRIKRILSPSNQCQFDLARNKIKEGGIGLILIENLLHINCNVTVPGPHGTKEWVRPAPFAIITKYLGRPDDIFECQAELITAGFEEYAKL